MGRFIEAYSNLKTAARGDLAIPALKKIMKRDIAGGKLAPADLNEANLILAGKFPMEEFLDRAKNPMGATVAAQAIRQARRQIRESIK